MKYVVAYDIADTKKRNKLAKALFGYGYRVNYSVFELELNSGELRALIRKIKSISNFTGDSIRFYRLCENCADESFDLAPDKATFEVREYYF